MADHEEIVCEGYDISRSAAIICTHVAKGGLPILSAVRDETTDPVDTGWQFHCGVYSHERAADGKVWAIKNVVKLDGSIRQVIDGPPRSSFSLRTVADKWHPREHKTEV